MLQYTFLARSTRLWSWQWCHLLVLQSSSIRFNWYPFRSLAKLNAWWPNHWQFNLDLWLRLEEDIDLYIYLSSSVNDRLLHCLIQHKDTPYLPSSSIRSIWPWCRVLPTHEQHLFLYTLGALQRYIWHNDKLIWIRIACSLNLKSCGVYSNTVLREQLKINFDNCSIDFLFIVYLSCLKPFVFFCDSKIYLVIDLRLERLAKKRFMLN